jgi:hypothetical protein
MRQLDDLSKAQFSKQCGIIVVQRSAVPSAGYNDRNLFGKMRERAWIDMVVMIMGQKNRGRTRQEFTPK